MVSSKTTMTNLTGDDIAGIHVLVAQDQNRITLQEKVFNTLFKYQLNYELQVSVSEAENCFGRSSHIEKFSFVAFLVYSSIVSF